MGRYVGTGKGGRLRRVSKKHSAVAKRAGMEYRNPTKYSHLVEFGTSHSVGIPFLRPAYVSTVAQVEIEVVDTIWKGIQQQLRG